MEITIQEIQENMIGTVTPHELAHYRVVLSGWYAKFSDELEEIEMSKPEIWSQLRKDKTSDAQTDRAWQATEMGMKETSLKRKLKKLEKMSSSCKTLIDVKMQEARLTM